MSATYSVSLVERHALRMVELGRWRNRRRRAPMLRRSRSSRRSVPSSRATTIAVVIAVGDEQPVAGFSSASTLPG